VFLLQCANDFSEQYRFPSTLLVYGWKNHKIRIHMLLTGTTGVKYTVPTFYKAKDLCLLLTKEHSGKLRSRL